LPGAAESALGQFFAMTSFDVVFTESGASRGSGEQMEGAPTFALFLF
jgi:hypothetical protein